MITHEIEVDNALRERARRELRALEWKQCWMWFLLQGTAIGCAGIVTAIPELLGNKGAQWPIPGLIVLLAMQALPPWRRWTGGGYKSRRGRFLRFLDGRDTPAEFNATAER